MIIFACKWCVGVTVSQPAMAGASSQTVWVCLQYIFKSNRNDDDDDVQMFRHIRRTHAAGWSVCAFSCVCQARSMRATISLFCMGVVGCPHTEYTRESCHLCLTLEFVCHIFHFGLLSSSFIARPLFTGCRGRSKHNKHLTSPADSTDTDWTTSSGFRFFFAFIAIHVMSADAARHRSAHGKKVEYLSIQKCNQTFIRDSGVTRLGSRGQLQSNHVPLERNERNSPYSPNWA